MTHNMCGCKHSYSEILLIVFVVCIVLLPPMFESHRLLFGFSCSERQSLWKKIGLWLVFGEIISAKARNWLHWPSNCSHPPTFCAIYKPWQVLQLSKWKFFNSIIWQILTMLKLIFNVLVICALAHLYEQAKFEKSNKYPDLNNPFVGRLHPTKSPVCLISLEERGACN